MLSIQVHFCLSTMELSAWLDGSAFSKKLSQVRVNRQVRVAELVFFQHTRPSRMSRQHDSWTVKRELI